MSEQKDLTLTKKTFERLCEMLDEQKYNYSPNKEDFTLTIGFNTKDLPMDFYIRCDDAIKTVIVISKMPFKVPEDKYYQLSYALALINMSLADGCFEFDFRDSTVSYRATTSYLESIISKGALEYILDISCAIVDKYNDKLFMFLNDKLTISELMDAICD